MGDTLFQRHSVRGNRGEGHDQTSGELDHVEYEDEKRRVKVPEMKKIGKQKNEVERSS